MTVRLAPDPLTRVIRLIALTLVALIVLWFLYRIRFVILLLVASAWVAYALDPLVQAFSRQQRRWRPLGIAVAYVVVTGALIIVGIAALVPAVGDARTLATNLPEYAQRLQEWSTGVSSMYLKRLPPATRPLIHQVANETGDRLRALSRGLAERTLAFILSLSTVLGAGALVLVISILLLSDKEYLKDATFGLIPRVYHMDAAALLEQIDVALSAFVRGQILIGVAVGIALWIGLTVLHVQYAVLLAMFTGVAQLVPDVGAIIGLVAGVTLAAFQGFWPAIETAALFLVVYQLSARVLGPWVMSRAVHIHSLIIILVTVTGAILGGVVGALLAVPLAAVAKVVLAFAYERLGPRFGLQGPAQS